MRIAGRDHPTRGTLAGTPGMVRACRGASHRRAATPVIPGGHRHAPGAGVDR